MVLQRHVHSSLDDYDPEQSAIRSLLRMMASEEATGQKATLAAAAEKIEAETAHRPGNSTIIVYNLAQHVR